MRKEIFESEEEAKKVIECIFGTEFAFKSGDGIIYIDRLKENSYIKKSIVEEAEEMFEIVKKEYQTLSGLITFTRDDLINKQHEAIQYLKERQI